MEWAALVRGPVKERKAVYVPPTDEEYALRSYMSKLDAKNRRLRELDAYQAKLERDVEDLKERRQQLRLEVWEMLEQLSTLPIADRIDEAVRDGMTDPREIVKWEDKGGLTPPLFYDLVCHRMRVLEHEVE